MAYNNYNLKGYRQLAGYSTAPPSAGTGASPDDSLGKQSPPTYVIIAQSGSYSFSYLDGTQASGTSSFIAGGNLAGTAPVKLEINPVKWHSQNGNAGDVIFVYRRMG